jgi:hypothetical protein
MMQKSKEWLQNENDEGGRMRWLGFFTSCSASKPVAS